MTARDRNDAGKKEHGQHEKMARFLLACALALPGCTGALFRQTAADEGN